MATRSIGKLGRDKGGPVDLTFDWFGHTIRVNPGAGELELVDFLTRADELEVDPNDLTATALGGDDEAKTAATAKAGVAAMRLVLDFLRRQVHPDDWDLFFDVAKTHRQTTGDLMEASMAIIEAVSDFPTGRPSGSSNGRPATRRNSKAGSSSPDTTRALALLTGRPDLQAAVLRASEAAAVRR